MALEDAIKALTEAVVANNELLAEQNANSAAILSKMGGAAAPGKTAKAPAKKAPAKKAAAKKLSIDTVTTAAGEYLAKAEDRAEKGVLGGPLKAIADHFGVARIGELEEENWAEAMEMLTNLIAAYDEGGADACVELDLGFSNEGDGEEGLI